MNAIKWLLAGFIGGAFGAVAWALLYHYADFEVGWIAWGIGALAGVGVRAVAKDNHGFAPGVVAVLAAVVALGAGKVGGLYFDLNGDPGPEYRSEEREFLTSIIASGVVIEFRHANKAIHWPKNADIEFQNSRGDFPADIWSEAMHRFDGYSDTQRQSFEADPSQLISEEFVVTFLADEIAGEWENGGQTIDWPEGAEPYEGDWSGDYPDKVWEEAMASWGAMSPSDRLTLRHMILPQSGVGLINAIELLPDTFSFFDIVWFGLAFITAYKIGANEQD